MTSFDPAAHPALVDLGARLRELAGDASYRAGHDYLRRDLVQQGAVSATTAYATVRGSTEYRVSVGFAAEPKVTCTCPAHRRNRYCKHVVAVCAALLQRPIEFAVSDAPPEPPPARPERSRSGSKGRAKADPTALRAAGLETVDRLLVELTEGGLASLGPDKAALLAQAGELVRALKLRRLGNLVLALQRAAGVQDEPRRAVTQIFATALGGVLPPASRTQLAPRGGSLEPPAFGRLLSDLYFTRRAVGAHLDGQIALDPRLGEDLLGKTWRAESLDPVGGLELVEVAYTHADDGEFSVETSYLADLPSGTIYAERQITPLGRRGPPKPRRRERLLVDEAGLYPGEPPRRLSLQRTRRAPLAAADIERLIAHGRTTVGALSERLAERIAAPFGPAEAAVLFCPAALVQIEQQVGALDADSRYLALAWPDDWTRDLPRLLPPSGKYALFGLLALETAGPRLHPLSVVSPALRWARGPIYPDAGWSTPKMQEIAARLLRVEARLERLLASGWRNAGAEAADLGPEADALAALGLAQIAERLRAVATAASATEALPAIVLAAAACRLLRARLPAAAAPPGQCTDLRDTELPEPTTDQLLPLARLALADGEAWACVRVRGAIPAELFLLEPLPPRPGEAVAAPLPPPRGESATPSPLAGLAARFRRARPATPDDADRPAENERPWLRRSLRGYLKWLARYPLGAAGKVEYCRMEAAEWPTPTEAREEALSRLRGTLSSGKLEDDQPVLGGGGALRLKLLDAREADVYTWVDGAAATVFRDAARDRAWALAWCPEGLITPLAVIVPGKLFAGPRLVHLVAGCPSEPL